MPLKRVRIASLTLIAFVNDLESLEDILGESDGLLDVQRGVQLLVGLKLANKVQDGQESLSL